MNMCSYELVPVVGPQELRELADTLKLLGDESRLRVVLSCLHESKSVGEIALAAGLSGTLVSHHLRILRARRFVRAERRGKHVFYISSDDHVRCIIEDLVRHVVEARPPATAERVV